MKDLSGIPIENFPYRNLIKVGDLVNFQGPLLSLFSNEKGELYLFDWSDSDEKYNRWLVFRITLNQLNQYLNKNLSHYQLVTEYFTECIFSVDIDEDLNYHNIKSLNVNDIPGEYLPDKDVLHDDEECPHLKQIKLYINKLELKSFHARKQLWQQKFNIPLAFDQMMLGCNKIVNREQLIAR